jgi:hypothetical protein
LDYEYPIGSFFGWEWGRALYRCECGDVYLLVGKRFLQVLPNGDTHRYKKLTGLREWRDDPRELAGPLLHEADAAAPTELIPADPPIGRGSEPSPPSQRGIPMPAGELADGADVGRR